MATIREKGPYQGQVQIRRKGWPNQNVTFRSKKDDEAWARKAESDMDRALFVDQSLGRQTTFRDLVELYLKDVTANRPSELSRVSEKYLRRKRPTGRHMILVARWTGIVGGQKSRRAIAVVQLAQISLTASSLNSRVNFRRSLTHLRFH